MRSILTEEHPGMLCRIIPVTIFHVFSAFSIGVYTCDMLSRETCQQLVEEVHHFEKWCKERQLRVNRPNSMNEYGAILDDFGLREPLDM